MAQEQNQIFVMPGDKVGIEEEFIPSENTYVDSGIILSSIMGEVQIKEGKISVVNKNHDIRKIKRGMLVIGVISDDLRAVMFVKLDNIQFNGVEYRALKDGKIVNSVRRPGGRDFKSRGPSVEEKKKRTAAVGDVILAKVLYDDPEIFTLGMNENETGVVYAECELCSAHLDVDQAKPGTLKCPSCKNIEERKISSVYDKMEEIVKLLV
jgi:exosome complex component CSL4